MNKHPNKKSKKSLLAKTQPTTQMITLTSLTSNTVNSQSNSNSFFTTINNPSIKLNQYVQNPIDLTIPLSIKRSTTADIVNNKSTINDKQNENFKYLRTAASQNRGIWINAVNQYFALKNMPKSDPLTLKQYEDNCKKFASNYINNLKAMAKNGIWNCMEFADFALIKIMASNQLMNGYEVHFGSLNDISLPEKGSFYYKQFKPLYPGFIAQQIFKELDEENHDHAFVVIRDKNSKKPVYVIDLWQCLIKPGYQPFLGSITDFINYLNKNVDGHYVRKNITLEDISLDTTGSYRSAAQGTPFNSESKYSKPFS